MNTIRTIFCAFGTVVFLLLGSGLLRAVEPPIRILPLGDSITKGEAEAPPSGQPELEGGYRDFLYGLLGGEGYNVDFIGTFADSINPELPDVDHQGWPGARVDQIDGAIGGWLDELEDPDVVLLLIGTNDFLQVARNETPAGVLSELDGLITQIAMKRPYAKIIVSTLVVSAFVPSPPFQNVDIEAKQQVFNAGIPSLVAQHVALGHQVSLVDMHPLLDPGLHLTDTVHPTTTGYEIMADAWLDAIEDVIAPEGTANPPVIKNASATSDLTEIEVIFSKPVADDAVNLANYNLSDGITISSAVLDAGAKRRVTLTAGGLAAGAEYILTVNGVRDRTVEQTPIAVESKVSIYTNAIGNGSFESGYLGWTPTAGVSGTGFLELAIDEPEMATDGSNLIVFNGGNGDPGGTLSYTVATTVGQDYRLKFDMGVLSYNTQPQILEVSGQGAASLPVQSFVMAGAGGGSTIWQPQYYYFTADSISTTLTFTDASATTASLDLLLDDVRLTTQTEITLAITASPSSGVSMGISPNDAEGSGSGMTGLIRYYDFGTPVTVTAPASLVGRNFLMWRKNGVDLPASSNSIAVTASVDMALDAVYESNNAPVATPQALTFDEEVAVAVMLAGTDIDSDPIISFQLENLPEHGALSGVAPNLTYTPDENYSGPDGFTFIVSDGLDDSEEAAVSIIIDPVNDVPEFTVDPIAGADATEDVAYVGTISGTATDIDVGDTLTYSKVSGPAWLLIATDGTLSGTPTNDDVGANAFTVRVTDVDLTTDDAVLNIDVVNVNDAPEFTIDPIMGADATEDIGYVGNIDGTAGDFDSGDTLSYSKVSGPAWLLVATDGTLSGTPGNDDVGANAFTVRVNDVDLTADDAVLNIDVVNVNDVPEFTIDPIAGADATEDIAYVGTISGTATDIDVSDTLTYSKVSGPAWLLIATDGTLSGTPSNDDVGANAFTVRVTDVDLTTDDAVLNIDVVNVNDAPEFTIDPIMGADATEDIGYVGNIDGTAGDFDSGDTLSYSKVSGPAWLLVATDGTLSGTPGNDDVGANAFTVRVTDVDLTTDDAVLDINVVNVNDVPEFTFDPIAGADATEDVAYVGTIAGTATDIDVSDTLTYSKVSGPAWLLIATDGTFSGTPTNDDVGANAFTVRVTDVDLTTDDAVLDINVVNVNDVPVSTPQSVSTDEDTPKAIMLTGTDVDGDTLTYTVTVVPLHGNLTGTVPDLIYIPDENYHGSDQFSFTTNDGVVDSETAIVSITVIEVGGNPYTEWLAGYGIVASPGVDSDQDAVSDILEYVVGGNPLSEVDTNLLPTAGLVTADPGQTSVDSEYLLFTYRRTNRAHNDTTVMIEVEWSIDLSGPWTQADGSHGEIVQEEVIQGESETDFVHVYIPAAPGTRLFARLRVHVDQE